MIDEGTISVPEQQVRERKNLVERIWNRSGARKALTTFSRELVSDKRLSASSGLLNILCWTSAGFVGIVLCISMVLFGVGLKSHIYLSGMVLMTTAIPFLNTLFRNADFWSWFLCVFLIVSSSLIAVTDQGISSSVAIFLLVPIFWSLLLLGSQGSSIIALIVLFSYLAITLTSIVHRGDGFGLTLNGKDYIRCAVLMLSAITFALIGWFISEGTSFARQNLIMARDAAQKANREKSELIASIAHEIRTPLTGLMGMLELLSREHLAPGQKEMADTARASSRDILNLINDLLDMSKMEIGELRLVPEPVNITEIYEQTVREFRMAALEKKLGFEVHKPDDAVWILIDPLRFRQILSNYLSNAIKFTESGRIKTCLNCTDSDHGEVRLRLEVSDTGPGIPSHLSSKIFGRFVQVEQVQKARFGGTGIGLAVVSDLARLKGGRVWVESVPDRGSSFFFECDFKRTSAMDIPFVRNTIGGDGVQRTILIADDSVGNQRVLTRVLRGLGYHTVSVANGADAVLVVAKNDVDVVLMDMQMPLKDGPSALSDIRALPAPFCHVPVIALSADHSDAGRGRWAEARVDGFIAKPIDFAQLEHTIRHMLDRNRNQSDTANQTTDLSSASEPSKKANA